MWVRPRKHRCSENEVGNRWCRWLRGKARPPSLWHEARPWAGRLFRRLMLTYRNLGQSAGALEVYRRCRHLLSVVLGVKPSAETEAIYRSLKAG